MISKNTIKFIKSLEQKKYRKQSGLYVAEGPKVVGDLLRCGHIATEIFATGNYQSPINCGIHVITDEELRKISFLQHPQQVLATFRIPTNNNSDIIPKKGLCLALDGVQDPGNLGTIIRLCDWFGINTIYCSPDTADAWNPKVVQATMGSIARVNIIYINLHEILEKTAVPIYGTFLDGQSIYSQELSSDGIIVMGNEGNGISTSLRSYINHKLLIPSYCQNDTAESLNVAIATAITCAEFRRLYPFKP